MFRTMVSMPTTELARLPPSTKPTLPSLWNQSLSDSAPKRYCPGGMSSARFASVTRQSRSAPFIANANSSSSGARWQQSAITSVLISGRMRTNCSMLP